MLVCKMVFCQINFEPRRASEIVERWPHGGPCKNDGCRDYLYLYKDLHVEQEMKALYSETYFVTNISVTKQKLL